MAKKKLPIGLLNTFSSLLLQIVTIINGFIFPRLILSTFGSETNGLVSSLSQFLNYISLLEGGVNGVIMASLYKPIAKGDNEKLSSIVFTSRRFFRRISYIFIAYAVGLAFIYPALSNSTFDYGFICTLTMILSIKLFSQYCFSLSYQNLLNASKRGYIISFSKILLIVLDIVSIFIITRFCPSIHLVEICSAAIYLIQPIIFNIAVKKFFKLNQKAKPDNQLIKSRWDGLSINIAYFIHSNTDVTLLTIFTNLHTISVYSVYCLVSAGVSKMINAVTGAISPSIGNLYALGDKEELNRKFDLYEYLTFTMCFLLFGVALLLITPFVMIYTSNITDTNYYQPIFGVLIIIAEMIYAIRSPYVNLAYNAGKFKDITKHAYIEAILNIVISIILVQWIGLLGVAIGTVVAITYRTAFQIWYLRDHLINRPLRKFLKRFFAMCLPTAAVIVLLQLVYPITDWTIVNWLIHAVVYTISIGAVVAAVSFAYFRKDINTLKIYLKHRH